MQIYSHYWVVDTVVLMLLRLSPLSPKTAMTGRAVSSEGSADRGIAPPTLWWVLDTSITLPLDTSQKPRCHGTSSNHSLIHVNYHPPNLGQSDQIPPRIIHRLRGQRIINARRLVAPHLVHIFWILLMVKTSQKLGNLESQSLSHWCERH